MQQPMKYISTTNRVIHRPRFYTRLFTGHDSIPGYSPATILSIRYIGTRESLSLLSQHWFRWNKLQIKEHWMSTCIHAYPLTISDFFVESRHTYGTVCSSKFKCRVNTSFQINIVPVASMTWKYWSDSMRTARNELNVLRVLMIRERIFRRFSLSWSTSMSALYSSTGKTPLDISRSNNDLSGFSRSTNLRTSSSILSLFETSPTW